MREIGRMIFELERAMRDTRMEMSTLEISKTGSRMGKGFIIGETEKFMTESGERGSNMVMESGKG